jgi:hypothetical protein
MSIELTASESRARPTRSRAAAGWLRNPIVVAGWLSCWAACGQTPVPRTPAQPEPEELVWRGAPHEEREELPRAPAEPTPPPPPPPSIERAPAVGPGEVLFFRRGEPIGVIARSEAVAAGMFLLDVGSDWVPPLFRSTPASPHAYEHVFVELANGRFDDGPEGRRAAQERYLEPHGIPPSPALLERRFAGLADKPCSKQLALQTLRDFEGVAWEEGAPPPSVPAAVVTELQARLVCEGHLRVSPSGVLDEDTRGALEEFERRNRIYARGSLRGETFEALRSPPLELERRALVRVLTERMVLDLGVIEDGSALGAVPARESGHVEDAPDVVERIQRRIVETFDLQSVQGVQQFYGQLADVLASPHAEIAIDPIELPDYYAKDMALWVEIDRGDLYYEFPFDEEGKPLGFRIERGPTLTLFARDQQGARPLAMYPTTIGGWRVRRHGGATYWEYKESPVGLRAWKRIVTAPVWLPPTSTPWETLTERFRRTSDGSEFYELNQNLIGPSFASAYGLVAAYHQNVVRDESGALELGADDGIRTHGSSDYTSIWRSVSSGCHRLHNHLAMRLFNFTLAHRAHRRIGHLPTRFRLRVSAPGLEAEIEVTRTGYVFDLARPLEVQVLPGRIRGERKQPIKRRIPAPADESARPTLLVTPTPGPS